MGEATTEKKKTREEKGSKQSKASKQARKEESSGCWKKGEKRETEKQPIALRAPTRA